MHVEKSYSLAQAAAISGVKVKTVHNAIDKRIVQALPTGTTKRRLSADGILRLKLWYGIGSALSADKRERLFQGLATAPTARHVKADDLLIVDVGAARDQVEAGLRQLEEAESLIHSTKAILGGTPVFKGTRIPVRLVASMLDQGATSAEILEGYPALKAPWLDLARIWVSAHPAVGRPAKLSDAGLTVKDYKRVPLNPASK
ncbi:hypothetical protein ABAC460_00210 [Asticcacaulis sp. AC460]|uniref:DUF433 domain-containing protein n=1 Tax=Asticcacaulis sp. AC460 TaxID=1282360 RepID=UPI0003C3FBE7|nr:DUF433 domain-containing protein [Asticcacaulis sp. AC460]ESQ93524.1 hypothetical protein ABAC460_00210 [Asticcacaulis sp. AC460]